MDQITFSDLEYQHKKRKTRREKFLERMELLIPWARLEKKIRRHYPRAGRGRHPYPLSVMLRIHCVQLFYNLSDPAMEDMLYEIDSVRRFVVLKVTGPIPDESTILKFRRLLESHGLGTKLFEVINQHLADQGLILKKGTIVDASIISAPSSTKNQTGTRDPEIHQAKKGNEWHFGMKMHIGVDDELGLTHSLSTSAANISDVTWAADLLHGDEQRVCGDSGYQWTSQGSVDTAKPQNEALSVLVVTRTKTFGLGLRTAVVTAIAIQTTAMTEYRRVELSVGVILIMDACSSYSTRKRQRSDNNC